MSIELPLFFAERCGTVANGLDWTPLSVYSANACGQVLGQEADNSPVQISLAGERSEFTFVGQSGHWE